MKDLATHALNQLLRLSAYTLAKLVVKRSSTLSLLLAVTAALAIASGTARADDWPAPGLDSGHARFTAERSGARFGDGLWTGARRWPALASPVVADGFVVTADLDGNVRALRADHGQLVWQAALRRPCKGRRPSREVACSCRRSATSSWRCGSSTARSCGRGTWRHDPVVPDARQRRPGRGSGFPREDGAAAVGRDGRGRLAEPAGDGAVQQHLAGGGRGAGGGRRQRRSLLRVRRRDGRAALGVRGRRHREPGGAAHCGRPRLHGGRRSEPPRARGRGGDGQRGRGLADRRCRRPLPTSPAPARPASARCRRSRRSAGLLVLQTRLDDAMDINADGVADRHLSRETVLAIDPTCGAVSWQRSLARGEVHRPERRAEVLRVSDARGDTRATEVRRWSPPPRRSRPRSSCLMQRQRQGAEPRRR